MGKVYDQIDDKLIAWIGRQRLFFVGTAPLAAEGHVNVSPKGPIESLRILGPRRVAYLDLIGSGAETIAHLRENGRIILMFCAFDGPPRVVRLHGQGRVIQLGEPGFADLKAELNFDEISAARDASRAIITVEVERISDSCGYGVPLMEYRGERPQQMDWIASKLRTGDDSLVDYIAEKNECSVDALPAVDPSVLPRGTHSVS
ncbi:MAG TPA: pyridoxamine 5'-phosphate oxidase family protein [Chloroflexota bacterium]|nr:pyridoxamine 5'-phosphate oxidase family protein [Chloroflexota bacterium]